MPEHVIAMDPGGRSGWASAWMDVNRFQPTGNGVLENTRMADWLAERQSIVYARRHPDGWPADPWYDVVVYESWRPRRQNGKMDWIENDPLVSAQHVGQIRWIARASGAQLVEQHPSDKPTAVKTMPEIYAALNQDSNEQHDQDARMHLWLYFYRQWLEPGFDPAAAVIL